MSRLMTGGLPGPAGSGLRQPNPDQQEGKRIAQRARCDAGITYDQIAAATGRCMRIVYDKLNVNDLRRQLSYSDLLALSRHSHTKAFVAHLIEPIEQAVRGSPPPAPEGSKPDGTR